MTAAAHQTAAAPSAGEAHAPAAQELICEWLVARNLVAADLLDHAADLAQEAGTSLRDALDRLGLVTQADYARAASAATGVPYLGPEDLPAAPPLDPRLSVAYLRSQAIAPIAITGDQAEAVAAEPDGGPGIEALRLIYPGGVSLYVAAERDIDALLTRAQEAEGPRAGAALDVDAAQLLEMANEAPTVRYVDGLFAMAIERRATDAHIEPGARAVSVRMRVDGDLAVVDPPAAAIAPAVISRIKILAGLDIAERRAPQDGRLSFRAAGGSIDVRVALAPTPFGETAVLRFLTGDDDRVDLNALNLPPAVAKRFDHALARPNGLFLITGPTGSGKTTTLHAALRRLNSPDRKIITIENPVEIRTPGLVQLEIDPGVGWTFASALRSVLRQDPDIVMVGEIRDHETAELAIRASLTGHLVLSTLHTNRASEAVARLCDMGVDRSLLAATLRVAAAQRLVRRLCDCAEPAEVDPSLAHALRALPESSRGALPDPSRWTLRRPVGCEACAGVGYKGRLAIFEALTVEEALSGAPGSGSLGLDGARHILSGRTTLSEVARVAGAPSTW